MSATGGQQHDHQPALLQQSDLLDTLSGLASLRSLPVDVLGIAAQFGSSFLEGRVVSEMYLDRQSDYLMCVASHKSAIYAVGLERATTTPVLYVYERRGLGFVPHRRVTLSQLQGTMSVHSATCVPVPLTHAAASPPASATAAGTTPGAGGPDCWLVLATSNGAPVVGVAAGEVVLWLGAGSRAVVGVCALAPGRVAVLSASSMRSFAVPTGQCLHEISLLQAAAPRDIACDTTAAAANAGDGVAEAAHEVFCLGKGRVSVLRLPAQMSARAHGDGGGGESGSVGVSITHQDELSGFDYPCSNRVAWALAVGAKQLFVITRHPRIAFVPSLLVLARADGQPMALWPGEGDDHVNVDSGESDVLLAGSHARAETGGSGGTSGGRGAVRVAVNRLFALRQLAPFALCVTAQGELVVAARANRLQRRACVLVIA